MMPIVSYAGFTKAQAQYIVRSQNSWLNVAEGGKRAGKNVINLIAWANILETHPDRLHLAAGVSQSAARMNIIDSDGYGLQWLFGGRCRLGQVNGRDALIINTSTGPKAVIIAGGRDSGSASLIKGHSYGTAYVTEANECHQTFVQEVIDRTLASKDRKLFFDLNPKPPRHWFYADFLDYQDELKKLGDNPGYNYGHFTIADNLSIAHDTLLEELTKYDEKSAWFKRDILGLRTAASGRIYTVFNDDCLITQKEIQDTRYHELSIGVDVGGTDATVATLCGFTNGWKEVHLIDGLYHKQGLSDKMSEDKYVHMIADWVCKWVKVLPQIGDVYVDSAAKLFRAGLRDELNRRHVRQFSVKPFNKADGINERISLNELLLNTKRFRVATHLKKWIQAYEDATWDPDAYEKGEWSRLDDGSFPVDCLDSTEYGFYPYKRYLL